MQRWLTSSESIPTPSSTCKPFVKKYVQIPTLASYRDTPPENFWKNFPFNPLPVKPASVVKVEVLRNMLRGVGSLLTCHQLRRGYKVCSDIENGADAYQDKILPPITVRNASSAFEHGAMLTDKIALWVDSKIVSGPFVCPPLPGFRSNPLMAVAKSDSVRPVINMSAPKGSSFNDNLLEEKIEKVWMSSALSFSYTVKEAGLDAIMSKQDLCNAYKVIPAKIDDLHLQGFSWGGKFFVENQMVFGATPSVANFDRLGNTLQSLALIESKIPPKFVHRTLDDTPVVAPAKSNYCEEFTKVYKDVCAKCGVALAPDCPKAVKAFTNVTKGTVLGVIFDTCKQEWSFPEDKANNLVLKIIKVLQADALTLEETREMVGLLNNFAQLCPVTKLFRYTLNRFLGELETSPVKARWIPLQIKNDLIVCLNIIETSRTGLPIAGRPGKECIGALTFVSDAAGTNCYYENGVRIPRNCPGDRGVASVGYCGDEPIWFFSRVLWPLSLLNDARDGKGAYFGSKTTTLEMIGLLIPFLCVPNELKGKHVVLLVDNIAIFYGWHSRGVTNDVTASILIRALYLISYWLGSTVHVKHLARRSSEESVLVDNLSRMSSSKPQDYRMVRNSPFHSLPMVLHDWLANPVEDWDFALRLLYYVISVS